MISKGQLDMSELQKKIAGQRAEHILKVVEDIFKEEGKSAALTIKNHLAVSFFKMILNDETIDDKIRNIAGSYLTLYEFLSNFDEQLK